MKNIVLIGFMGAGKSRIGKLLAKKLGYKFVDTDEQIKLKEGKSISEIFKDIGEQGFRDIESQVVAHFSQMSNLVISTGGGVPLRKTNMDNLRSNGLIVFLSATPQTVYERVKGNTKRPLLQTEDPFATICKLIKERTPYYSEADLTVETDCRSPLEVVQEIVKFAKLINR